MLFKKKESKIITDEARVEEILTRSIDSIYPKKDALKKELLSGRRLRVYVGIDPTATYVHLGHATNYLLLRRLHRLGHKIIVLIGDFTAMIGDPSDKTAARVQLTQEEVQENLKSFKKQIGKILDFDDTTNPIEFAFNATWLAKLTFKDAVELASHFTVQQMVQRDVFEKRLKEEKPLFVHEFFYPLMQGYDSVALEADLEIGGTDQTFNMLAGRTLVRKIQNREKFIMTTTLLENPKTGQKLMSKSEGTGIGLDEEANQMYGKVMALPDEGVVQCFVDCTEVSLDEVADIKKQMEGGKNPRDIKMRLAKEIVALYHGESMAEYAEQAFEKVFSKKEMPNDMPSVVIKKGESLIDIVMTNKLASSKSDYRRLVEGGGVHNASTEETITDPDMKVGEGFVLKIGKRRFLKIETK